MENNINININKNLSKKLNSKINELLNLYKEETLKELQERFALIYTGQRRLARNLLRDVVGFDKIKEAVVNPLKGRKIAPYYGCLLLRPSSVMQMDDPENPKIIEDLIRALGGEPVHPLRLRREGGHVPDAYLAAQGASGGSGSGVCGIVRCNYKGRSTRHHP